MEISRKTAFAAYSFLPHNDRKCLLNKLPRSAGAFYYTAADHPVIFVIEHRRLPGSCSSDRICELQPDATAVEPFYGCFLRAVLISDLCPAYQLFAVSERRYAHKINVAASYLFAVKRSLVAQDDFVCFCSDLLDIRGVTQRDPKSLSLTDGIIYN